MLMVVIFRNKIEKNCIENHHFSSKIVLDTLFLPQKCSNLHLVLLKLLNAQRV